VTKQQMEKNESELNQEETAAEVRTKVEKSVEYLKYDFTKDELAELSEYRLDSGESVRTKNLTADELQVPLPV